MATGRISDVRPITHLCYTGINTHNEDDDTQIMVKQPHCLREGDSVLQAAKLMKDQNIGVIPVIDDNRKPCGILTDRDIVIRCVADKHEFQDCKVGLCTRGGSGIIVTYSFQLGSVLSRNVQKIYEDQDINEAIDLMKRCQLHRLELL